MRTAIAVLILSMSASAAYAASTVSYTPASPDDPELSKLIAGDAEGLRSAIPTSRPEIQVARVGGSIIVQGSNGNACGASNCKTILYRDGSKLAETFVCDGSAGDHKLLKGDRWLSACGWLVDLTTGKRPRVTERPKSSMLQEIDHNSSTMLWDGESGVVSYLRPKASIAGTIKPGDVLLVYRNGQIGSPMIGTAWVYKKGCAPAPYPVAEVKSNDALWAFRGSAPQWSGCEVVGYRPTGANNELRFGAPDQGFGPEE